MYSVARLQTLGMKFIEHIKKWTREDKIWNQETGRCENRNFRRKADQL